MEQVCWPDEKEVAYIEFTVHSLRTYGDMHCTVCLRLFESCFSYAAVFT